MTVEEATDRLLQTYSVYGVGREFLTGLMEDGIQNYNLSVEAVFHGTRTVSYTHLTLPTIRLV